MGIEEPRPGRAEQGDPEADAVRPGDAAPPGSVNPPPGIPADPDGLAGLLGMMQLTDSALPTGAFSHSLGFESYLQSEQIADEDGFSAWLEAFVDQQLTYTDALAVRLVYAASGFAAVEDLDELVTAQALPEQIRRSGITMGRRLLSIGAASYPSPWTCRYQREVEAGRMFAHQATVWGVLARSLGLPEETAVAAHLYAAVTSLTQNAVRGIPLGQSAGQRVIRRAQEWVRRGLATSRELVASGQAEEALGAVSPGLEIAQMNHERQRARLFMS